MISSSCWVPRGFASEFPEHYDLDDAEMERISKMAQLELDDAKDDLQNAQKEQAALSNQIDLDDDLKEYDLENYDEEETEGESISMFPGLAATDATFQESGGDAYLTLPDAQEEQEAKQEMQIYPTDSLVLATRTEDDVSYLDVYVYDDGAGAPDGAEEEEGDKLDADVARGLVREPNLYVHHDLMLPAFPLCVEWVNFRPGTSDGVGNFAAIGTFDPQIEVWNLDCVDKAFPDMILGEVQSNSAAAMLAKKKKKKSKGPATTHHTDAVLSLAHNRNHRSVLASTSADSTVKLWDLANGSAVRSISAAHGGKTVSSSQWHATEASILLTGGYDSACAVSDVRIASEKDMCKKFSVGHQDVESVRWGARPEVFYCGTDNGNVYCFDVRSPEKPVWTLHAHDAGISALDVSGHVDGMLVTAAMGEKVVKLWKCPAEQGGPSMVLLRDFGVGNVLTASFAGDLELAGHMSVGGVLGALKMWDCFSNRAVRNAFSAELGLLQKRAREVAQEAGRASRIARKYKGGAETVMTVEAGRLDDSEDEDEDEEVEEN